MEKHNMIIRKKEKEENELTASEFQEKLYMWLSEQGLIADLRGHLRKKMVNTFQEKTSIAPTISQSNGLTYSPLVQTICTLVAEFLLHQGNSYTLSVYTAEVPHVAQLFSQFSQRALKKTLESGTNKFAQRDVEDILQTLGLVPGSESFTNSLQLYHESPNNKNCNALLVCIIRSLSTVANRKVESCNRSTSDGSVIETVSEKNDSQKEFVKAGAKNLSPITCLREYMKSLHEEDLCRVRKEESEKYKSMLEETLKEVEKQETRNFEKKLMEWKENAEKEFGERERNLCQLATQLRTQHSELAEKLLILELKSQEVTEREMLLREERERETMELKEAYDRLSADKEEEAIALNRVEAQQREIESLKRIQAQYNSFMELQEGVVLRLNRENSVGTQEARDSHACTCEDKALQTSQSSDDILHQQINKEAVQMVGENQELRDLVTQQRQRIEEITMRAAELANQLQDAQVALHLASSPNRLAVTTPPLTAPPNVRLLPRPNWPPHIGSGEETPCAVMRAPVNNSRDVGTQRRLLTDARRRSRRNYPTAKPATGTTSDESTTDDMVREARSRLRRLEQESCSVRQDYEQFRDRLNDATVSTDVFRQPNPFDGFKRAAFITSFPTYPNYNNSNNISNMFNNTSGCSNNLRRNNVVRNFGGRVLSGSHRPFHGNDSDLGRNNRNDELPSLERTADNAGSLDVSCDDEVEHQLVEQSPVRVPSSHEVWREVDLSNRSSVNCSLKGYVKDNAKGSEVVSKDVKDDVNNRNENVSQISDKSSNTKKVDSEKETGSVESRKKINKYLNTREMIRNVIENFNKQRDVLNANLTDLTKVSSDVTPEVVVSGKCSEQVQSDETVAIEVLMQRSIQTSSESDSDRIFHDESRKSGSLLNRSPKSSILTVEVIKEKTSCEDKSEENAEEPSRSAQVTPPNNIDKNADEMFNFQPTHVNELVPEIPLVVDKNDAHQSENKGFHNQLCQCHETGTNFSPNVDECVPISWQFDCPWLRRFKNLNQNVFSQLSKSSLLAITPSGSKPSIYGDKGSEVEL